MLCRSSHRYEARLPAAPETDSRTRGDSRSTALSHSPLERAAQSDLDGLAIEPMPYPPPCAYRITGSCCDTFLGTFHSAGTPPASTASKETPSGSVKRLRAN